MRLYDETIHIPRKEILHALRISKPDIILVEEELLDNLECASQLASSTTSLPEVFIWGQSTAKSNYKSIDVQGVLNSDVTRFKLRRLSPGQAARETAFICFSSGTSGPVKGVRLSHGNVVANIFQQKEALRGMFQPDTVMVLAVPFFHILGLAGFSCQFVCQVNENLA